MGSKYKRKHSSNYSDSSSDRNSSESDSEHYSKRRSSKRKSDSGSDSPNADSSGSDSGSKKESRKNASYNSDLGRRHHTSHRNKSKTHAESPRRHHRHEDEHPKDSYGRSTNEEQKVCHRHKNNDKYKHKRSADAKQGTNSGREHKESSEYTNRKEHRHQYDHNRKLHKPRQYQNEEPRNYKSNSSHKDRRFDHHTEQSRSRRSPSLEDTNTKWGKNNVGDDARKEENKVTKQKPNFGLSGKLTEETNTYRGIVIKYSEPPEARKPKRRWRLYPFKGEKALQTLYIHRESGYLIGRERKVVDIPVDHPSCSKQHAALQYRLVTFTRDNGSTGKRVRPYIIDLDSANGTYINNKRIDPKKYVELLEKDVIKFGYSSREYVLLHENSKDEAQDDDIKEEEFENLPVKEER